MTSPFFWLVACTCTQIGMKKAPNGAFFPPNLGAGHQVTPKAEVAMLKLMGSSRLRELLHLRSGLLATGLSATNQRRWMLRVAFLGLTRPGLTSWFLAPTGTACYGYKLYLQVSEVKVLSFDLHGVLSQPSVQGGTCYCDGFTLPSPRATSKIVSLQENLRAKHSLMLGGNNCYQRKGLSSYLY